MQKIVEKAYPLCLVAARHHRKNGKLPPSLEVTIVSDRTIAAVHKDFMGIEGPTDVITFPYGEIVISAETARRNARHFENRIEAELALYVIHGILHLLKFDDKAPNDASLMRKEQQKILKAVCRKI